MTDDQTTRRIELTLRKPWFALHGGIKPTLVIGGRGQPAQWGVGTWRVPADETVVVGVFLFNRVWRFGSAEFALEPHDPPALGSAHRRFRSYAVESGRTRTRLRDETSVARSRAVREASRHPVFELTAIDGPV